MVKTANELKNSITDEMVAAAKLVFAAMAARDVIKPIVEGYQKVILQEKEFYPAEKWQKHGDNKRIVDSEHTYLMEEKDFDYYLKRCNEERIKAKLHVNNPENCPLLVAENNIRKATNYLMPMMEPITGICYADIWDMELSKKYVHITLSMLANKL